MNLHKGVLVLLVSLVILAASTVRPATAHANPNCTSSAESCGKVNVPYPFSTQEGCSLDANFLVTCNEPDKPLLGNLPVLNISLDGELRISNLVAYACYNDTGGLVASNSDQRRQTTSEFPISYTRNKFTVVGCDTSGIIAVSESFEDSCTASCNTNRDLVNGSCSGNGCCQTAIPQGVEDFNLSLRSFSNHSGVWNLNPCDFAFVAEEDWYSFSSVDLFNLSDIREVPVVLDWAIGKGTCEDLSASNVTLACMQHSTCYNSNNGQGYLCNCSEGYRGNPYLECHDINECQTATLNQCLHNCHNINGSYTCSCPRWYSGDGRKDGNGCTLNALWIKISIGIGVTILVIGCSWLFWRIRRRKLRKRREQFYRRNGGLRLEQELSKQDGSIETIKIFTIEELKKATNGFDENAIIGRGGYGTVYRGVLPQNKIVAVKRSTVVDQSQIEQFVNEVVVVSQINHRNVVTLLGCCLESEVPLLVYEFITNGTLFHHIHEVGYSSSIPWEIRLRIAKETAGALSYLHSAASTPIIHRDVKSTNILLDDNFTAKVSDFGASRLVPLDKTQLTTMVQGTFGYLDPEYFHTSQLSEKSDVYSFGVVLVELLTARKAILFDRPENERNLATYFISSMKENQLSQILDHQIVNIENTKQIHEVANLAQCCLRIKGDERPTMKEVAIELEGLMKVERHKWVGIEENSNDTEYLLGESMDFGGSMNFGSTSILVGYDSLKHKGIAPLDDGR
ncbi:hypothetical protein F0562_002793 [Nyssa sinensis]|uniref:Protein kinase domain-containing protein n=1 Tax=Nyssa sinensis TaxID=561372 RepID=A0A5J5BUK4_9ASTE|nr:hypothetical protein F0562_002793 [Nyssa sinensis]